MNLSFLPGNLHLKETTTSLFIVTLEGQEILSSKSQRVALAKFNSLREELEKRFPSREPTAEEKAELLQREIGNSLVGHNSLGGRKKKTSAGGTRTFGG
jgi:bisphosphoglycerate-independent phosphoglycerate mutase (AlkP superfamily)